MTPVPATVDHPEAPLFSDGLGDRVVAVDAATGDLLQILRLRPQLLAVPSFEFALRERAARLANFRHAYYARVRRIDRHPTGLAIVSDHVEGVRLSDMLRVAAERGLQFDLNAALCLLRQLVPSVALLHENARDVAHGLVAPERLIVTPRARIVVVEHVMGSAVEQLQYNRERLWQELRVAVPVSVGAARFDHRADVTAIGLVALALGRRGGAAPSGLAARLDRAGAAARRAPGLPVGDRGAGRARGRAGGRHGICRRPRRAGKLSVAIQRGHAGAGRAAAARAGRPAADRHRVACRRRSGPTARASGGSGTDRSTGLGGD